MKNLFLAVVLTILISGCSMVNVQVDYDSEYDFSSLSSFAVMYTKKNDERDFTRARVSKMLNRYMQNKGYINVDKGEANFYITVHLDIQKKSQVETNYETMGIRPVIYPYMRFNRHIGTSAMIGMEPDVRVTTSTYEYEVGKLILEIVDVKSNNVVWQGIAEDEFSRESSPEKKSSYINKIIEKLFKDFPPK